MSLKRFGFIRPFFKLFPNIKLDSDVQKFNSLNFKGVRTRLKDNVLIRKRPYIRLRSQLYTNYLKRTLRVKSIKKFKFNKNKLKNRRKFNFGRNRNNLGSNFFHTMTFLS